LPSNHRKQRITIESGLFNEKPTLALHFPGHAYLN